MKLQLDPSLIKPTVRAAEDFFLMLPVGAGLDILTGSILKGRKGESIIHGGLGPYTGYVGRPNRFKSTLMHYMAMSAMNRIMEAFEYSSCMSYDTERNMTLHRLKSLAASFKELMRNEVFDNGMWVMSNTISDTADKWYEQAREFMRKKTDNAKQLMVETPWFERDMQTIKRVILPTFAQVDSLSMFQTSDVLETQAENAMGESGGNMIHARLGLVKTRLMMEIPSIAGQSNTYIQFTAHLNDQVQLAQGPYAPKPVKQLEGMREGEKIKGVSTQFLYLMTVIYEPIRTSILQMSDTRKSRYPRDENDDQVGDTDLLELTVSILRSKVGGDRRTWPIVLSKTTGIDSNLTFFNYIDQHCKKFGIGDPNSKNANYMVLYPEVKFTRVTIRRKMAADPKLARAVEITGELAQIRDYWGHSFGPIPTPEELYQGLKDQGYDWDELLSTRGYYTLNQYDHPVPFLSTPDLINMYRGLYKPFWK